MRPPRPPVKRSAGHAAVNEQNSAKFIVLMSFGLLIAALVTLI
ncbi:hypothetical protein [Dechloromonas sp. TW-R-39-2]|nr:hypothetical protein [Dechloromonas sp. TW-R-39-2]